MMAKRPAPIVPRLVSGGTVVCVGGGPSLTKTDLDFVRGRACVVAINDAYRLAPWADVLYSCDARWWDWHRGVRSFTGPKYSIDPMARWTDVQILRNTGTTGLERDPRGLRTGRNSGYQAVNLAVHLGAARIVLLGYDMSVGPRGETHWFGDHPNRIISPYASMLREWPTIVAPLDALGIAVINCSRRTALDVFPRADLETVFSTAREEVAS